MVQNYTTHLLQPQPNQNFRNCDFNGDSIIEVFYVLTMLLDSND